RVAFIVGREGGVTELWVISREGANAVRLARGEMEFFNEMDWSPRSDALVFTRTPTGSNTNANSEIWRVQFGEPSSNTLTRLTFNNLEEARPRFSPDGNSLAFLREGDVFVEPLAAFVPPSGNPPTPTSEVPPAPALPEAPLAVSAQLTPPAFIRVSHTPANAGYPNCRPPTIAIGEIDVIPFETYVKWVTPSESPASWDPDALKSQAVAARTYGWRRILDRVGYTFDVYDSTADQAMCELKEAASTDAATDQTRGQYLAYNGDIILAQYGAENSDPTTTTPNGLPYNQYLIAVDDPVGLARTLSGHGRGMSQWGAQRWATQYDWNYEQILLHYYSNTTLEAPFAPAPDITAPIGSLILPWSNWGVNSNRTLLVANASDNSSSIAGLDFIATFSNGVTATLAHLTGKPWQYVADASAVPNQNPILVSARIVDGAGNSFTGNPTRFALDRILPTGTMTAPAITAVPTITLNLNATDLGSSGLTSMAFSNNWVWEGENQYVDNATTPPPSGAPVSDTDALNGSSMRGLVGTNPAGFWFGPYTTDLPFNQKYRAYFRVKTDNVLTTTEVAMLDVVVNAGSNVLGIKRLRGIDFRAANQYQEFYVDFYYSVACNPNCLEFRVAYRATANLWLDRILVVSYPEPYAPTKQWILPPGQGLQRVIAKFIDGAGNISADSSAFVKFTPTLFIPALLRR
ncbi:MAG TPA: SpoIID/LytB domain-containing protein, partial [Anaerolineae bacterium]